MRFLCFSASFLQTSDSPELTQGGEVDRHACWRRNTGIGEFVPFRGPGDEVGPTPVEDITSSLQGCMLQTKPLTTSPGETTRASRVFVKTSMTMPGLF